MQWEKKHTSNPTLESGFLIYLLTLVYSWLTLATRSYQSIKALFHLQATSKVTSYYGYRWRHNWMKAVLDVHNAAVVVLEPVCLLFKAL